MVLFHLNSLDETLRMTHILQNLSTPTTAKTTNFCDGAAVTLLLVANKKTRFQERARNCFRLNQIS